MGKNAIPIIVPLYKSYHCLERFIKSLELEKTQPFVVFFLDNEYVMDDFTWHLPHILLESNPPRPRIENTVARICTENKFNLLKYVALVSKNNNLYSESVNMLVDEATRTCEFDRFVILNPDCYALKENWLSDMVACWDSIKRNFGKKLCTLGSLQWGDEAKTQIWHIGTKLKPENEKCHPADWMHIHYMPELIYCGSGVGFHRVDGNTGTGVLVDYQMFESLGSFDSVNYPHYSSDYYFCEKARLAGYYHCCCDVPFFHQAGNSVKGD